MGLFRTFMTLTGLKDWGSAISQLQDSDRMMKNLSEVNPKAYHPDVYRGGVEYAQKYQADGALLTVEEFSLLRLVFFAVISNNQEDFTNAQKYVDVVGRVRRIYKTKIRQTLDWEVSSICNNLKVVDSNPMGVNKLQQTKGNAD